MNVFIKISILISIVLLLVNSFFLFWGHYLRKEKLEILVPVIAEEVPSSESEIVTLSSSVPLATPAPGSEFVLPVSSVSNVEPRTLSVTVDKEHSINLPILLYHHIDLLPNNAARPRQILTVSPSVFDKQMEYLFNEGFQTITFDALIEYFDSGQEISEKSLIITFDDGWKSQFQYAFPVLKKYNFRATFFPVANYIGAEPLYMDWAQLKELKAAGMEIGSHTMNHPNLLGLFGNNLQYELQNSKVILENQLQCPIDVFAYPYGVFSPRVAKAVQESGYQVARSTIDGIDQNPENRYTLKSIEVYDNLFHLKQILNQ